MGAELEELQVQDLGCEGSGGAHVSTAVLEKVLRAFFGAERTCPAVLYREEDQDDNWNEEKESDEVGCLQDRRSLTGRSDEDHRLAQREREREKE